MRKLNLAAAAAAFGLAALPAAAATPLLSINLFHGDSNGNCADTRPGSGCSPIGVTQVGGLANPFLNDTATKAVSLAPGSYYLFANPYAGTNFMTQGAGLGAMITVSTGGAVGGDSYLMIGNATVPDLSVAGVTLFDFANYGVKITTTGITGADRMSFGYPPSAFAPDGNADFVLRLDYLVPSAAVPEPAAWAMMIAGFGLAGSALRRRRTAVYAG
jgi:hypothetical protein